MKTIILTILGLALLSSLCDAQTKQYQPTEADMQTKLSVSLDFTAIQLNNYSFVLKKGGPDAIMKHDDLSAAQATRLISDYYKFSDSVHIAADRVFMKWYKEKSDKWAADTLRAFKAKPLPHTN